VEISKALYKKLIDKNKKAQLYFYKYCFNVLMRVAIRYKKNNDDAAILVNESFLKILQNLEKYNLEKPLEPWIRRITINVAIDDFRKNKNYLATIQKTDTAIYENTFSTKSVIDEKMVLEDMLDVINKLLPKATKVVFFLKNIDGYSHKEIAERLEISIETSKWHIKNANKLLRLNKDKLRN
jgi:RNA polymerase sigma-70 factor (ECF subfamily)